MRLYKFLQQSLRFKVGDFIRETRTITQHDLDKFSQLTGDHNPIHKSSLVNPRPLVHGAFINAVVAGLIGTKFPGPGTIVISQNFSFPSKCFTELPIEIFIELLEVRKILKVKYEVSQENILVYQGEAKLMLQVIPSVSE